MPLHRELDPWGLCSFPGPPPRRLLTFDFSCPWLGGTKPARSRDKRQDARSNRAMAGWGGVSGSLPETLSDPGPPSD